jgi:heterotetrameric sarcosine oxidase gamma subunit
VPDPQSPFVAGAAELVSCRLRDESHLAKWRIWEGASEVALGTARHQGGSLIVAVAPGEWMVVGDKPNVAEVIDMTHVRAAIRLTGVGARALLECVCALDLSESMTPDGAAARTLVAGVATELIRDDVAGEPSYLLLMSRSFARSVWSRLEGAASQPLAT